MRAIIFLRKHAWIPVLLLSLLPLAAFLVPGLPQTHDGRDHVARIANFYVSLAEGRLIPRWAGNLNWGYGHPILMFLYPLPSYIASLFRFLGLSFIDSTKAVFVVSFVASVLSMYLFASSAYGVAAGVTAAVLYGFAPYRFVDLYVRGAIGEHLAFVFPPLIFHALWRMSGKRRSIYNLPYLAVCVALLILSHNALAIMFLPVAFLYAVYLLLYVSRDRVVFAADAVLGVGFGFFLSAFFWIPAFFEGKYTLRDIVTRGEILSRFSSPASLFWSAWNFGGSDSFTKELGFPQWAAVLLLLFLIPKTDRRFRIMALGILGTLCISLFLITSYSAFFWEKISLLQKFQFPWRFLSVSVFSSSLAGAMAVHSLEKLKNLKRLVAVSVPVMLIAGAVLATSGMWKPVGYLRYPESFYTRLYPGTTDTGESSPIWSVRFMEHRPDAPMDVISGKATVSAVTRTSTVHTYTVSAKEHSRLVENTLYFPGWRVYVDGILQNIEFQDPSYRGLMTFDVDPGMHDVRIVFTDTKVRQMSEIVSGVSLFILTAFIVAVGVWKRRKT